MEEPSRIVSFLKNVRVLDLSRHLPGPFATMLLADMGADVLKIEAPGGDEMRQLGPKDEQGQSLYFASVNAGKASCRLDLKTDGGREQFMALVAEADVLVESFRPGVMERLGIGYEKLKSVNPRLIYCSLSGYGKTGPMSMTSGHDGNYLALSGILHRNAETKPLVYDPPVADWAASLIAAISILGALCVRTRDGRGCEIDLALADVVMPLQSFQLAELGVTKHIPQPGGGYLNGGAAYYQVYATADGRHVMLGAIEAKFWASFCVAAGHPEWLSRYDEPEPQAALKTSIAAMFAALTLDQCLDRFGAVDCCLSPVLDLAEAVNHVHHRERGLVRHHATTGYQALFPAIVDGKRPPLRAPLTDYPAGGFTWDSVGKKSDDGKR